MPNHPADPRVAPLVEALNMNAWDTVEEEARDLLDVIDKAALPAPDETTDYDDGPEHREISVRELSGREVRAVLEFEVCLPDGIDATVRGRVVHFTAFDDHVTVGLTGRARPLDTEDASVSYRLEYTDVVSVVEERPTA